MLAEENVTELVMMFGELARNRVGVVSIFTECCKV